MIKGHPKYVSPEKSRLGVLRYRFRRGTVRHLMKGRPGTEEFDTEYKWLMGLCEELEEPDERARVAPLFFTPRLLSSMMSKARERATASGKEFSITRADVLGLARAQRNRCAVSRVAFDLDTVAANRKRPHAPSLDRIDNALGYVPGNVRLVTVMVNLARLDWDDEAFQAMCRNVARTKTVPPKNQRDTFEKNTSNNSGL